MKENTVNDKELNKQKTIGKNGPRIKWEIHTEKKIQIFNRNKKTCLKAIVIK